MTRTLILAGIALITVALTACSPGIHTLGNSITFDSSGMVVHAQGHPNAHVSRDGALSIDGKAIAVTPAQRQMLQHYYQQGHDVIASGEAMGKHGVAMAERGIGDAISSIFHSDSSTADKRLQAESQTIQKAADKLCAEVKALGATQNTLAAEIPAFAPYASGDRMQCTVTHTTTKTEGSTTASIALAEKSRNASTRATEKIAVQKNGQARVDITYDSQQP